MSFCQYILCRFFFFFQAFLLLFYLWKTQMCFILTCVLSCVFRREGLSKCGKCKQAYYCNVECQVSVRVCVSVNSKHACVMYVFHVCRKWKRGSRRKCISSTSSHSQWISTSSKSRIIVKPFMSLRAVVINLSCQGPPNWHIRLCSKLFNPPM